jgi:hypothetical protein
MKIKISYTPEDGHVGRNMCVKDSENLHNKAVRRLKHNLQNPLNTVQQDAKIYYWSGLFRF